MTNEPTAAGLTAAEVAERVARGQVNRVRRSDAAEYLDIVRRNVFTLFNALVVPAALALLAVRDYRAGISVSGMMLANTILGLVQEMRAKRHLDRLAILTEAHVRVLRDGQVVDLPASEVVLGDHVLLAAGDSVVADGTVVEARFLEVDEALLTGESDPVPRRPGDPLLSGSFAVAGDGRYRADRVGMESFAQRTAAEARSYRYVPSPMQRDLDQLISILTATAVVLSGTYILLFYAQRSFSADVLFQMIAATITSMVPQGLVLMTTLAFILGAVRMAARGALVQRLNAVESMAAVDVLCMDKTGTLTTNRLRLEKVHVVAADLSEEAVRDRLRWFASTSLDQGSKSLAAVREALGSAQAELLDQLPFKSQNRYSAVRLKAGADEHILALGAFEALEPFVGEGKESVQAVWKEMLTTGLRLLLFAEARPPTPRPTFDGSLTGFTLRPLALVALNDELRPEATRVLEALAEQGISFKIISGDNPETVRATVHPLAADARASALRALAEMPVVTGAELEKTADPETLIRTRGVFGRVAPEQKVQIVRTLQAAGHYVAMIGDGVNDVLPIKNAHLGIAMGEGSRASKTVSGLVLETNDFGLLPETLEEGRNILRNLRRVGKLFLTKNIYALLLILGALAVLDLPFPFKPQQVTLLNLLTIGIPAVLITLRKEQSAAPSRPGFVTEVGGFSLRTGILTAAAGLAAMLMAGWAWEKADPGPNIGIFTGPGVLIAMEQFKAQLQRTFLLSTLVLLGLITLLRALTDGEERPRNGDQRFRWFVAGAIPVYLLAMYWPLSAWYHELMPLNLGQWAWVLCVTGACTGLLFILDRITQGFPRRVPA